MKLVSKYKSQILILLGITSLYLLLRLPNLTSQPIFADEAIYIRWSQVMRAVPSLWYLPLTDGKTPLYMWILMPFFNIFSDPLFAGRFLSILSGLATLGGVFFLGRLVFNTKAALIASILYVVTPYTVFFDRMALVDSMLSSFTIWAIYFAIRLVKSPRLNLAVILGVILGGAWLTKTPAFINLFILPITILGFQFKKNLRPLFKLLFFWGVTLVIVLFLYNLLRLSPGFHMLSARNADYIFSPTELLGRPLDPFIPHMKDLADWLPKLVTWPIIASFILGLYFVLREKNKLALVVLLWALFPALVLSAFLKTFTARYLLFCLPPLLLLAGYGLQKVLSIKFLVSRGVVAGIVVSLMLIPALQFDYLLLVKPEDAPIPREGRKGYFEDWTAGYGFKEIAEYLVEQKKKGSVVVGTEGYFGTLPDGLFIYLDKASIPIIGSHPTAIDQLEDALKDHQVFYVSNGGRVPFPQDKSPNLEKIKEYPKIPSPDGHQNVVILYQIKPR